MTAIFISRDFSSKLYLISGSPYDGRDRASIPEGLHISVAKRTSLIRFVFPSPARLIARGSNLSILANLGRGQPPMARKMPRGRTWGHLTWHDESPKVRFVELRQYKNDYSQSKRKSNFEIAALFHYLYGEGKSAAISKLDFFIEWSRSYIALALGVITVKPLTIFSL